MPYTKNDLIAESGLPDSTIRNYVQRGLIPGPTGHGLAAVYSEDARVRAIAIGRLRARGAAIRAVEEHVKGWTTARYKRFVTQTNPEPPPAPAPEPATPPATRPMGSPAAPLEALPDDEPIADLALPAGPSFRVVPLLPGLGLLLDEGASPIVQRVAAEIVRRYGRPGAG